MASLVLNDAIDHTYCIDMNYYRINLFLDAITTTYCIRFK